METAMPDDTRNMEEVLDLLSRAEDELAKGASINEVCSEFAITEDELKGWCDQYAMPPNAGDSLSNSSLLDAVFPIFHTDQADGPLDQVGSGVIVEIGDELFALTAAHVTDHSDDGVLYMPAVDGIVPISGGLSYNPVPSHGSRDKDNADMAYYHLSSEWRCKLHPSIKPGGVDDLLMTDDLKTGDLFTFVGYPWRKTKRCSGSQETDRATYTGHALPPDAYKQLGYNRAVHIVIRMRLKKTYSTRYQSYQTAPHPQGISGGAVFAWPWTFEERLKSPDLKLAGIGHTFHPNDHCMVSTRIIPYIMAIVKNNPHLANHFMHHEDIAMDFGKLLAEQMATLNPNNVPSAVGIGWYKPDAYQRCLTMFDDAADLPDTFDEWLILAEQTEMQIKNQGMRVVRVEIDPDTFPDWCAEHGFSRIVKDARMAYGNTMAAQILHQNS